jgi:hypothetical protein
MQCPLSGRRRREDGRALGDRKDEVKDGPAERKVSLQPDEGRACYAACRVVEAERVLPNRFCWINGSSTSPQLIHRRTVPSVENSGLDSSIINPLHF